MGFNFKLWFNRNNLFNLIVFISDTCIMHYVRLTTSINCSNIIICVVIAYCESIWTYKTELQMDHGIQEIWPLVRCSATEQILWPLASCEVNSFSWSRYKKRKSHWRKRDCCTRNGEIFKLMMNTFKSRP